MWRSSAGISLFVVMELATVATSVDAGDWWGESRKSKRMLLLGRRRTSEPWLDPEADALFTAALDPLAAAGAVIEYGEDLSPGDRLRSYDYQIQA